MDIRKNDKITNLSSRKLWQLVSMEQQHPKVSHLILEAARKELIKRNQYTEYSQFNRPH